MLIIYNKISIRRQQSHPILT